MLMIEPPPLRSIPGRQDLVARNIDLTLTLKARFHCSKVQSRRLPCCTIPAQLNSTLTSPASWAVFAIPAGSVTSSTRVRMPSLPSISASVFELRSVTQTRAPSRAKASAAARPMPCAAAVMNAVFPASLPAMEVRLEVSEIIRHDTRPRALPRRRNDVGGLAARRAQVFRLDRSRARRRRSEERRVGEGR